MRNQNRKENNIFSLGMFVSEQNTNISSSTLTSTLSQMGKTDIT